MEFGGLRTVRKFSRGWKVEPGELRMLWGEGGGATFPDNLGFLPCEPLLYVALPFPSGECGKNGSLILTAVLWSPRGTSANLHLQCPTFQTRLVPQISNFTL